MAEWLDTVFKGFDFALFRAMHDLALAAGEPMTALMRFISFFAHDGLCMFALGLLLMCFRRTRKMGACVFLAVCCGGLITNITAGRQYQAEPFPEFIQNIIRKGGLLASLQEG